MKKYRSKQLDVVAMPRMRGEILRMERLNEHVRIVV